MRQTPKADPAPAKARPARDDCCFDSECDSGLRNNYFVGKRLTPDAFRVEQRYFNERRQLLNRAIHGWGVVYGYKGGVDRQGASFVVGPGLALDEPGRELVQAGTEYVGLSQAIALDEEGKLVPRPSDCGRDGPPAWKAGTWLLSVHYAEKLVGALETRDPCDCTRHEWDKVCETVRYTLRPFDSAKCCAPRECELCCECGTGPCCGEDAIAAHHRREKDDCGGPDPVLRGGCSSMCEHLTDLNPESACHDLTEIREPCGTVRVDLRHGVPLACVTLEQAGEKECPVWRFGFPIDTCGPRRLVKRNDLLFDLLQGCDLTRIKRTGWAQWHRTDDPMDWDHFLRSWGADRQRGPQLTETWWVEFTRGIRVDTLRPDCFSVRFIDYDEDHAWGTPKLVPILGIDTWRPPGTPAHLATVAKLVIDAAWFGEAVDGRKVIFEDDRIQMIIEIDGSYMIDCNGQAPDLDNVGLLAAPTGNGTPGGVYRSHVLIGRKPGDETMPYEPPKPKKPDNEPRPQGGLS